MTGASAVIGLRRFWAGEGAGALPYSSPLLEGKRTKNKGQREQEASRTAALVSRCRGRLVYSQGLCSRSGPGPVTALSCSVLCSPRSGHAPTLPHTSLIFPAGNCDMWSPALPSLRGHRNRNSCQYLLDQAVALLISIRYYMWLLMPSNSCESCNHTRYFGNYLLDRYGRCTAILPHPNTLMPRPFRNAAELISRIRSTGVGGYEGTARFYHSCRLDTRQVRINRPSRMNRGIIVLEGIPLEVTL